MKKIIITLTTCIFITIIGLFLVNINLNRQIYFSIAENFSMEVMSHKDKSLSWNLDQMSEVLTYPEKYQIENINIQGDKEESRVMIPKIRVFFNLNPFDFRIDTDEYAFIINKNIVKNIKEKINIIFNEFFIKENTLKI